VQQAICKSDEESVWPIAQRLLSRGCRATPSDRAQVDLCHGGLLSRALCLCLPRLRGRTVGYLGLSPPACSSGARAFPDGWRLADWRSGRYSRAVHSRSPTLGQAGAAGYRRRLLAGRAVCEGRGSAQRQPPGHAGCVMSPLHRGHRRLRAHRRLDEPCLGGRDAALAEPARLALLDWPRAPAWTVGSGAAHAPPSIGGSSSASGFGSTGREARCTGSIPVGASRQQRAATRVVREGRATGSPRRPAAILPRRSIPCALGGS
jgi:hypothetical protein